MVVLWKLVALWLKFVGEVILWQSIDSALSFSTPAACMVGGECGRVCCL